MASNPFVTRQRSALPDAIAPDGSEVRLLGPIRDGSMAVFTLGPGGVAKAVRHRTGEEIWYVAAGRGRIWRKASDAESVDALAPGVSLVIPRGTHFQFRNDGDGPLDIVGVTMPPWPGAGEAELVAGTWPPTV